MMLLLIVISVILSVCDAAKILGVFPTPAISHQTALRPLMHELARRGHEVIVVTPDPAFPKGQAPANLTEIDVHDISYQIQKEQFKASVGGRSDDLHSQLKAIMNLQGILIETQVQNEEFQDIIRNQNGTFDLIFIELCFRHAWALTFVIKAPAILISSFGTLYGIHDEMGSSTHPLLYPEMHRQKLVNLTFWEKATEIYNQYYFQYIFNTFIEIEDELNRKLFGPDTPSVPELMKNIEMLFVNLHPIWDDNRPVPPNVVFMGGIHQKSEKELPKDLKIYLDSSKHGVIYISFGSYLLPSMLPPERIQILVNVFSKLPYDVLWKYDKDDLPGRSKNIRLEKWLPQSDLLRHPKVKLFITQGGLQSTDEAITAGVPLIGMPILGDQWFNVDRYVQHKIGVRVDMETLTEEIFKNAIKTVVDDDSYHQNIIRLRDLIYDQSQTPLERAAWWAEHVIRHKGAKHLKSSAAHLTWAQYYEIEFLSILIGIVLSTVLFVSFVIYLIWKSVSRSFNTTDKFKKL